MTYIQDLGITDTEYVSLVTQGYDPLLETQLIHNHGAKPAQARKVARFLKLLHRQPQTEVEWQELITAWEETWEM
ncbi:hypothetical protein IJ00_25515 [Calothrix sp. 336/3]|nr:hypothetical protein [Calothrix sp. 336/3]AKG24223.1 hypothetical protein IJ00_25515 [Calothrix sp. 336/3]